MKKLDVRDFFIKMLIYASMILLTIRVLTPILLPTKEISNLDFYKNNLYHIIMEKSIPVIETTMVDDDNEDRVDLLNIVFKYITDIDLGNPKSYIASQFPILSILDIGSLIGNNDEPVVVVPNSKDQKPGGETPSGNQVIPGDVKPIPPRELDPKKPLVLIYHTHTTENYNPNQLKGKNFTTDFNVNICRVGEEIKKELETTYGIATIHDTTIHDLPKREGAYEKSRPTLQKLLKEYPSVKLVIDLHRDGVYDKNKVTAMINNQSYARTYFVIGTKNSNYKKNVDITQKLIGNLENLYPGFNRGISYKKTMRCNQDLTPLSVLLEVGSEMNTLDEAIRTSKIISRVIAESI